MIVKASIFDDAGLRIDTIEYLFDGQQTVWYCGAKLPLYLFMAFIGRIKVLKEKEDDSVQAWRLNYDEILNREIQAGFYAYDRYADQEYDGLESIEL